MLKSNSIRTKLVIRFSLIFILLFALIIGTMSVSFRHLTLQAARENALTIAKTIRDGITSLMVLGVIHQRDVFLEGMTDTSVLENVKDIRILRGERVIRQFGPPKPGEIPTTEIEYRVFTTGKIQEELHETLETPEYFLVIPYRASSKGRINCLRCHAAQEGDILGAISITFDLTNQRKLGVTAIFTIAVISLFSFIFIFLMVYHFFKPYSSFFEELKDGFEELEEGRLGRLVQVDLDDEAGDVAAHFNRMLRTLSSTFNDICHKVYILVGFEIFQTGNAIKDTVYNVDQLIRIYRFKRSIERDVSKREIYLRIQKAMLEMGLETFSIYEINFKKGNFDFVVDQHSTAIPATDDEALMATALAEQRPKNQTQCRCLDFALDELVDCPARYGEAFVGDFKLRNICSKFQDEQEKEVYYQCLPVIGEVVGNIVQIACHKDNIEQTNQLIPYVKSYLQEASGALEIKTAMEFIREQALVDELTGLYNRRYLEEISGKLIDINSRSGKGLGFIMIDVDHFKKVNDEYGHDAGDAVLRGVTKVIKASVRKADVCIRFGGEEMLVLANNINRGDTLQVAEKIRKNIEAAVFECGIERIRRTVSLGVAEYPMDAEHFWICIKNADIAMYHSKSNGRNQVTQYHPDLKSKEE